MDYLFSKNDVNGVRQRLGRISYSTHLKNENSSSLINNRNNSVKRTYPRTISQYVFLSVYLVYASFFLLQIYLERYHYPIPFMNDDVRNHPEEFIAERAMARLVKLTNIGPRVAGSYENEVLAVEFLKTEIDNIIRNSKGRHRIEMEIEKYSGSFPLRFLDGLTNVYKNVQNVIVKLYSKNFSPHSLLMNCHFDSVPDSPGGSDDGAGCAVMLEILEVLSKSNFQLENNIIFLFNGAEENLMHGSHGFITQHRWAKEVRAFINLEACGAGGREVLFQSGPNSPWIMEIYAKSVLHPFASSMAQEVFESGVIPGDTDFRVFRDFGNISGLDFAWSTNGYVYHTRHDNVDQIPLGALQRTGDNMLALAKGLVNAEEMKDVAKYKEGNLIYFDILGLFLVRWSESVGEVINCATVFLSFLLLYISILDAGKRDINASTYFFYSVKVTGVILLSYICSALCVLTISFILSSIGKSMSWYSRPLWLLFLYVIPSITTAMAVQQYFASKFIKIIRSRMALFQMHFDVYQFLCTMVLLGTIVLKIRSGYVAWMWVFGPCIGILIHRFFKSPLLRGPDWKWFLFLFFSLIFPVIQHSNMQVGCLALFIPIMGRSGKGLNSEIVIALFTNLTFGMLFAYVTPLVILLTNPKKILMFMCTVFLFAILLLLFTPLGFPYTGDNTSPRPQRYMILQTERTFYNYSGEEINFESGFWVVDHDYNSPQTVIPFIPEMSGIVSLAEDCEKYLYCGLPYLMPVLSFIKQTHWIPSKLPKIESTSELKVISRKVISKKIERITLEILGGDHMGLIISPRSNVEFVRWSLNEEGPVKGPTWKGQETFFVYYASSSYHEPWTVALDFKVPSYNNTLMDVALINHILHGPQKTHISFKKMLAKFPSWTVVTSWTATYKSYSL